MLTLAEENTLQKLLNHFFGDSSQDQMEQDQQDELKKEEAEKQAVDARDQAQKLRDLSSLSGGSSF